MIDWLIGRLIDWLVGWLIDWLAVVTVGAFLRLQRMQQLNLEFLILINSETTTSLYGLKNFDLYVCF